MRKAGSEIIAASLYQEIVAQARATIFYAECAVPDTIEGRFEMVALHCALVLRRLRAGSKPLARLGQPLLDYMFNDLDRSIREIGVGDMSVGKYMKRLGKSFYGRATAYDKALDGRDVAALAEAICRNILATSDDSEQRIAFAGGTIARYVAASDVALSVQSDEDIAKGTIRFPAVEQEYA